MKEGAEMHSLVKSQADAILSYSTPVSTRPETYIPPTKPYELSQLANDLVLLARYLLKPKGRLVFFLPTVTDEYEEVDIPTCEGMLLVGNSMQNFGKWGRRVWSISNSCSGKEAANSFNP